MIRFKYFPLIEKEKEFEKKEKEEKKEEAEKKEVPPKGVKRKMTDKQSSESSTTSPAAKKPKKESTSEAGGPKVKRPRIVFPDVDLSEDHILEMQKMCKPAVDARNIKLKSGPMSADLLSKMEKSRYEGTFTHIFIEAE